MANIEGNTMGEYSPLALGAVILDGMFRPLFRRVRRAWVYFRRSR
jgi:hypothetical protein